MGAAGVFVGVAMVAKVLVPPLAAVLGWPATRIGGAAGRLARGNAMRNPTRTASTASALMIGLALVTLVSVLAAGLKSTFESSVNQLFQRRLRAHLHQQLLAHLDRLRRSAAAGCPACWWSPACAPATVGRSVGKSTSSGVPPDISRVIDVKWQHGSHAIPAELGASGAFVSKAYAKELHLHVGSPIAVETPPGGSCASRCAASTHRPRAARRTAT